MYGWGLGQSDDNVADVIVSATGLPSGFTDSDSIQELPATGIDWNVQNLSDALLGSSSGSSGSSGSSTSPLETGILNLANIWTKIGGQVVAPTTTIMGPNGELITTPSSSLSALSASGLLSGITGGSSSGTLLLLLGLGVAAVLILGKK